MEQNDYAPISCSCALGKSLKQHCWKDMEELKDPDSILESETNPLKKIMF